MRIADLLRRAALKERERIKAIVDEEYRKLLAERGVSQSWLRDAILRRVEGEEK